MFKNRRFNLFKTVCACFAASALLFVAGCSADGADAGNGTPTSTAVVSNVSLNFSTLNLGVNDTQTLTATVKGSNLTDTGVTWTTSQESVVTVSSAGIVTAGSVGTARITATSNVDSTKSAYCDVTVESNKTADSTKEEINVGTSAAAYNYSYTGSGATIYIYSLSGGLNFYGIKVGNATWLVSDLTTGTYSETTSFASNGITFTGVIGSSSDTMTIESSNATISGTKYTRRLKTGGGGSQASRSLMISVDSSTDFVFYAVSSNSSSTRTMVIETVENGGGTVTIVRPSGISLDHSTASLERTDDAPNPTVTITATITNAAQVTSGYDAIEWKSSNTSVATVANGVVTAAGTGTSVITASTVNGYSASCTVTVTGDLAAAIRASDSPTGWASYIGATYFDGTTANTPADSAKGTSGGYGASSSNIYTVSTRSELLSALSGTSKKIIYIDGMIDMTDGMLPSKANGTSSALDSWIKTKASVLTSTSTYGSVASDVTSLATWKTWYAAGNTNSSNESGVYAKARSSLSSSYGSLIKLNIPSNTTIIGLTSESGIKGGCIKISGATNVVLRNLFIQDSFDPFPQIEKGDGFNANWDCIEISDGSKYIWIDHCTIQDTIATTDDDFDHVSLSDGTSLKYQVFDGLCDIKEASDFITVSYCKFANHDKTSLIGHSASYTDDINHQTITLHHNYYYNCRQRLPMVRFATIHIYNNYYTAPGGRGNSYCIGLREQNKVYAENNYFDSSVTPTSNSQGDYYFTGNNGKSDTGTAAWAPSSYYTYTADSASDAKTDVQTNAGAGVWSVVR